MQPSAQESSIADSVTRSQVRPAIRSVALHASDVLLRAHLRSGPAIRAGQLPDSVLSHSRSALRQWRRRHPGIVSHTNARRPSRPCRVDLRRNQPPENALAHLLSSRLRGLRGYRDSSCSTNRGQTVNAQLPAPAAAAKVRPLLLRYYCLVLLEPPAPAPDTSRSYRPAEQSPHSTRLSKFAVAPARFIPAHTEVLYKPRITRTCTLANGNISVMNRGLIGRSLGSVAHRDGSAGALRNTVKRRQHEAEETAIRVRRPPSNARAQYDRDGFRLSRCRQFDAVSLALIAPHRL